MATTSSRRVVSRRSHERPNSKADDPWCFICGVNLALDGRTFTVVSSHQNPELCDVLLRVLAMTFTHDQAFVNVCNRCERQLKRLGRTTSIAMARQEGRKFRAQVEGNVAKHGLQGVELGDFRNLNITKPAVPRKPQRDDATAAGAVLRRGDTADEASNARKSRELYSRSNSSVRAEDKESGQRAAYNRDRSAPERKTQARDLHSSGREPADKTRDVVRGNRSSFQKPSLERTASFRPISDDTKSAVDRRGQSSIPSQQRGQPSRDGKLSKMNSVDMPKISSQLTTAKGARDNSKPSKSLAERKAQPGQKDDKTDEHRENSDLHNESWELSSGELNPFTADIEREMADADRADVVHAHTRGQPDVHQFQPIDGPILTDDDNFINNERAVFMESSQSSQSSSEAGDDVEKSSGDHRGSSPQIHGHVDATGVPYEDDQVRPGEQLTADDENKDRTKRLRVTFSDTSHEPLVADSEQSPSASASDKTDSDQSPPAKQDSASDKTASDKGDVQQDSCPLITETEDNRDEQKHVYDFEEQTPGDQQRLQEVGQQREPAGDDTRRAEGGSAGDTAEGEGQEWHEEEHGLIETDRLAQDQTALVSETGDWIRLELTTSSSFLRHNPDSSSSSSPQSPWLYTVSKVIQVTHLQPPEQLDDVDLKVDEEETFVKNTSDHNGSQVSLQPMQVEDTSAPKSEASPLIDKDEVKGDKRADKGKDSKFKDQQPGLPCCTIL